MFPAVKSYNHPFKMTVAGRLCYANSGLRIRDAGDSEVPNLNTLQLMNYTPLFREGKDRQKWRKQHALKLLFIVTEPCLTLWNPMDCSPPGSSVHGISQARTLEWAAMCFRRGIFRTQRPDLCLCIGRWILYHLRSHLPLKHTRT